MYQNRPNTLRNNNRFTNGRFDSQRYFPHRRNFDKYQNQNNRSINRRLSEWPRQNQNFKILYDTENTTEIRSRSRSPEVSSDLFRQIVENTSKVDLQMLLNKQEPPTDPFAFSPLPVLAYKRKSNINCNTSNIDLIWQKKKDLQADSNIIDQTIFSLKLAEIQLQEADLMLACIQKTLDSV